MVAAASCAVGGGAVGGGAAAGAGAGAGAAAGGAVGAGDGAAAGAGAGAGAGATASAAPPASAFFFASLFFCASLPALERAFLAAAASSAAFICSSVLPANAGLARSLAKASSSLAVGIFAQFCAGAPQF